MADLERVINEGARAASQAIRAEVANQVRPIVERTQNGLAGALGLGTLPRSANPVAQDDDEDDEDGEDWIAAASELTHFYGLDGAREDAVSRAVAVWRSLAVTEGTGLSHWIAVHDDGFAACGPAAELKHELADRSKAQGIAVGGWTVHTTAKAILALEYDLADLATYAAELCDDDEADNMAEQMATHDDFNWEHVATAVTHLDVPGVSACWQIGQCLQVETDRGVLDFSTHNALPFALAVRFSDSRGSVDTLLVHGSGVCVLPSGISVGTPPRESHEAWASRWKGRQKFQLDGIDAPAYEMGEARVFDYRSNKDDKHPHKFKDYTHEHGEESGELPKVFALGPRTFAICGGNMWVAPEGIRD